MDPHLININGHIIIMDSLLCPWGKKALPNVSLNSTRLIQTLPMVPLVSVLTGFLLCYMYHYSPPP